MGRANLYHIYPKFLQVPNQNLTLVLLNRIYLAFANRVDPDRMASSEAIRSGSALFFVHYVNFYQQKEAIWSGFALFVIHYVNFYLQSGLRTLIGWQLEMGVASLFIQLDKD